MTEVERKAFLAECAALVDAELQGVLPPETEPPCALHSAMRYAVFSGGKRLRPSLAFATALACGVETDRALPVAASVELLHAYSLVHDDLPSMDDDAERRGRPTVHVRYGEATAILVGDALQAAAFETLSRADAPPSLLQPVIQRLARAAGSRALVGGQSDDLDLARDGTQTSLERLVSIHERKTAALFGFAVWGAGVLAGASEEVLEALDRFGLQYGLAFQVCDDVLDDDPAECSVLSVLSREDARQRAREHRDRALEAISRLGARAEALRALGENVTGRVT